MNKLVNFARIVKRYFQSCPDCDVKVKIVEKPTGIKSLVIDEKDKVDTKQSIVKDSFLLSEACCNSFTKLAIAKQKEMFDKLKALQGIGRGIDPNSFSLAGFNTICLQHNKSDQCYRGLSLDANSQPNEEACRKECTRVFEWMKNPTELIDGEEKPCNWVLFWKPRYLSVLRDLIAQNKISSKSFLVKEFERIFNTKV